MLKKPKCPVIAIEEHYWDRELSASYSGVEGVRNPEMMDKLHFDREGHGVVVSKDRDEPRDAIAAAGILQCIEPAHQ